MTLDRHEAHDDRNVPSRDAASDRPLGDRPMADREVPLPGLAPTDDPAMVPIHQWLDGELAESDARRVDDKQVEMWKRIADETDQRRRMVTPAYVATNIMNALPEKQASFRSDTASQLASTFTQPVTRNGVSFAAAVAIGAAMLAVGFVIGKMLA